MAVRKSTASVKYNNDLNGSTYNSKEDSQKKRETKRTVKVMSYKRSTGHRRSNADSVAEQFLATSN
ncbi:hypothetical protein DC365_17415 [Vibrio vulnificus]|uniref:Uncharacterized protein n=2 Tax=Vibrio TaxID=662 RepID=A0AA47L9J4_VIBPH|nr:MULTISPECIES: hypothetical protein [Vibrio]MBE3699162.1 hypothetical protein [Vibrio parahaemolyticus]MBE3748741.1 hypothetical protein [Vibrio parahaemolyticus]MBE3779045.1 hypothetical protein [Vibrio parahaemolyticus]MBE4418128.1 hypothetical protein [Vibrio parahaemolyticus]MBE4475558.1 hypothetical protein [Vibrio parahaemolyticus]